MRADLSFGFLVVFSMTACSSSTEKAVDSGILVGLSDGSATTDRPINQDLANPDTLSVATADVPVLEAARSQDSALDMVLPVDAVADHAPIADSTVVEVANYDTQFAPDVYEPGPIVPIAVNSGNTATFNLAKGQWSRYSFPAEAGQIYSVSEIKDPSFCYLGTTSDVSPNNYLQKCNADGVLIFTAPLAQTYYLAVSVEGDNVSGLSGPFQVADGGKPLVLGENTVSLTSPTGSDGYYFRFPITQGKSYQCTLTGTSKLSLGFTPAPRAERMGNGQPAWPLLGVGSGLPISETIPADSVAKSVSGHYFLYVGIHESMTLNITLMEK